MDEGQAQVGNRPPVEETTGQAGELARLRAELARARRRIAELEAQVEEDPLVPVRNRRGFQRALARAIAYLARYGTSASLVFIDLDGFKAINDAHGHAAGDAMLRAIGEVLIDSVRASDVVGRIGGDEFAIILWNVEGADAARKAAELVRRIAACRVGDGGEVVSTGASAGVTALAAGDTPESALARADARMYEAKRLGTVRR